MTATVVCLLPIDELAVLKCFLEGTPEPKGAEEFYDSIDVPSDTSAPRLNIAVAQILLHHIQEELPQWTSGNLFNRKSHVRHAAAKLAFSPRLICCINWADSGPGFSWPESYHLTYIPGFDKYIITSSRDGDDVWGCADHAIGVVDGDFSPEEAARITITSFWQQQFDEWDQQRWAYLFSGGLVGSAIADRWAAEVWPDEASD